MMHDSATRNLVFGRISARTGMYSQDGLILGDYEESKRQSGINAAGGESAGVGGWLEAERAQDGWILSDRNDEDYLSSVSTVVPDPVSSLSPSAISLYGHTGVSTP